MRPLATAAGVVASLALGWLISMLAAYEPFTFVPGPVIVAAVLYRLLRRREATPRDATLNAVTVIVLSCAIAAGALALADAFGDAVGEVD